MKTWLAVLPVVLAGCGGLFGPGDLRLEVAASGATFPQDGPFGFSVTAENTGEDEVVWGRGSSSCQLDVRVRVDGRDQRFAARLCTADLAPQRLGPGERRTEQLSFEGTYFDADSLALLPPGTYEFRGVAGDRARSAPVKVQIRVVP